MCFPLIFKTRFRKFLKFPKSILALFYVGIKVIADGKPFIGIIYLKPGHILPEFTLQSLDVVFNEIDFIENPFIIVAKHNGTTTRVRVRQF